MVQKKRKSKRQTPKGRFKLQKKVKAQIKANQKLMKKQDRKIPRHVLMTDEEKHIFEQQKIENIERQKTAITNTFALKTDLETVLECAEILVEVLDVRDVSRKYALERDHFVFLSKTDLVTEEHVQKMAHLLGVNNVFDIKNVSTFVDNAGSKNIGIIGCKNAGRNTLKCMLSGLNVLDIVGTVEDSIDLSAVLRNAIDLDKVDLLAFVNEVLNNIDKSDLALYYQILNFDTAKEFLNALVEKQNKIEKMLRFNIMDAAKRFLHDLHQGKITWYFDDCNGSRKIQFIFRYDLQ